MTDRPVLLEDEPYKKDATLDDNDGLTKAMEMKQASNRYDHLASLKVEDDQLVGNLTYEQLSLYEKKSVLINRELDAMNEHGFWKLGRYQWGIFFVSPSSLPRLSYSSIANDGSPLVALRIWVLSGFVLGASFRIDFGSDSAGQPLFLSSRFLKSSHRSSMGLLSRSAKLTLPLRYRRNSEFPMAGSEISSRRSPLG